MLKPPLHQSGLMVLLIWNTYLSTTPISVFHIPLRALSPAIPPPGTPFLLVEMIGGQFNNSFKDLARLARTATPPDGSSTNCPPAPSRISLLPSVRLPNILAHRDTPEETPTTDKDPILTLEASSRTLIDCTVADNVSSTPLYSVKTVGASTKVTRNSSTGGTMQFATIRWPKVLPTRIKGKEVSDGVEIQMGNHRYLGGGSLLKYGPKPK